MVKQMKERTYVQAVNKGKTGPKWLFSKENLSCFYSINICFQFFKKKERNVTCNHSLIVCVCVCVCVCVIKIKQKRKKERKKKKITALRVPRLSPTLVLTEPEEA